MAAYYLCPKCGNGQTAQDWRMHPDNNGWQVCRKCKHVHNASLWHLAVQRDVSELIARNVAEALERLRLALDFDVANHWGEYKAGCREVPHDPIKWSFQRGGLAIRDDLWARWVESLTP